MAIWKATNGKPKRGPNGAKRKAQQWRLVLPNGQATEWKKGKPC